jgi:hypothetical protein
MAGRGPKIGERAYARSPIFGYSLSFREVLRINPCEEIQILISCVMINKFQYILIQDMTAAW